MASNATDPPTQLGNYDLLYKIAEGGMGAVYKGRHRFTGEIVAVKVIAASTAKNPVLLQRFEREFQAAKVIDHPQRRARPSSTAAPARTRSWSWSSWTASRSARRSSGTGAMPEAEAVRLIAQVCDGLQRAHKQGLVHRDVKPDNILVTRDGVAKLTDLGLVKDVDDDLNLTKTGRGLGTPHFMAPEQFRNAKKVDVRGDIYSPRRDAVHDGHRRGAVRQLQPARLLDEEDPQRVPAAARANPALSDRVDWAIRRSMSADPDKRPASCREFLEDLTGQSRQSGPQAQPAAARRRTCGTWCTRTRRARRTR